MIVSVSGWRGPGAGADGLGGTTRLRGTYAAESSGLGVSSGASPDTSDPNRTSPSIARA